MTLKQWLKASGTTQSALARELGSERIVVWRYLQVYNSQENSPGHSSRNPGKMSPHTRDHSIRRIRCTAIARAYFVAAWALR